MIPKSCVFCLNNEKLILFIFSYHPWSSKLFSFHVLLARHTWYLVSIDLVILHFSFYLSAFIPKIFLVQDLTFHSTVVFVSLGITFLSIHPFLPQWNQYFEYQIDFSSCSEMLLCWQIQFFLKKRTLIVIHIHRDICAHICVHTYTHTHSTPISTPHKSF